MWGQAVLLFYMILLLNNIVWYLVLKYSEKQEKALLSFSIASYLARMSQLNLIVMQLTTYCLTNLLIIYCLSVVLSNNYKKYFMI